MGFMDSTSSMGAAGAAMGMGPWGLAAGATLGILQAEQAARERDINARLAIANTRYSPWAKPAEKLQFTNPVQGIISSATGGANIGYGIDAEDRKKKVADAHPTSTYALAASSMAGNPWQQQPVNSTLLGPNGIPGFSVTPAYQLLGGY